MIKIKIEGQIPKSIEKFLEKANINCADNLEIEFKIVEKKSRIQCTYKTRAYLNEYSESTGVFFEKAGVRYLQMNPPEKNLIFVSKEKLDV